VAVISAEAAAIRVVVDTAADTVKAFCGAANRGRSRLSGG